MWTRNITALVFWVRTGECPQCPDIEPPCFWKVGRTKRWYIVSKGKRGGIFALLVKYRNLRPGKRKLPEDFTGVYTVFHPILSNAVRLSIQCSWDTSSHANYRPTSFSRKECNDHLWEVLLTHDVVKWTSTTSPLSRLPTVTKHQLLHQLLQFVPQGSAHVLPSRNQNSPYQGFWPSDFHVRRLWIRFGSQSVVVFIVLVLEVPCLFSLFSWPIVVVPLCLSFCIYHLPKRRMLSVHVWASFRSHYSIIVLSVTSPALGSRLF